MSTRPYLEPNQTIKALQRDVADLKAKLGRVGSVATSGSNSDGEWVRFADGTLIVWHSMLVSANPTVWTFPQAFNGTPFVQATPVTSSHRTATISTPAANATTVNVFVTDSSGSHVSTTVRLVAFGQEA